MESIECNHFKVRHIWGKKPMNLDPYPEVEMEEAYFACGKFSPVLERHLYRFSSSVIFSMTVGRWNLNL